MSADEAEGLRGKTLDTKDRSSLCSQRTLRGEWQTPVLRSSRSASCARLSPPTVPSLRSLWSRSSVPRPSRFGAEAAAGGPRGCELESTERVDVLEGLEVGI